MLVGDLDGHVAFERLPAGDHFEEHDPDGVESLRASPVCRDQLGGQVGDSPDQGAGAGAVRRACQAEVAELDPPVVGDQDVLRLDVAVDHAGGVRGAEPFDNRIEDGKREPAGSAARDSFSRSRSVCPRTYSIDQIGEIAVMPWS